MQFVCDDGRKFSIGIQINTQTNSTELNVQFFDEDGKKISVILNEDCIAPIVHELLPYCAEATDVCDNPLYNMKSDKDAEDYIRKIMAKDVYIHHYDY